MSVPSYPDVRKAYVKSRVEELDTRSMGNWRQARKDEAHREFNAFMENDRYQTEVRVKSEAGWIPWIVTADAVETVTEVLAKEHISGSDRERALLAEKVLMALYFYLTDLKEAN